MTTRAQYSFSIAKKVGLCAWIVFIGVLVLPYAVVGETWGMVWFQVAAPLSVFAEATVGIGAHSYFLIALVSAGAAAFWAMVVSALIWVLLVFKKQPNNSPEATPGQRPPAAPSPSSGAPQL